MNFAFIKLSFDQQNYMEAFKSISKIFSSIDDLPKNAKSSEIIAQFKKKIKEFINEVTAEVWELIDKYEKQITYLKQENRRLKEGNYQSKHASTNKKPSAVNQREETTPSNAKSRKINNLDFMPTTKSNLFTPFAKSPQEDAKFTAILAGYKKGNNDDNIFGMEFINQQPQINGKSVFEVRAQHKKQREEELRNFLQTGRKSMNHTTERYLSSIGKQKKPQERSQHAEVHRDNSDSSISLRRKDSGLNQSLGDVCNNLDNSIVARRARSSKKKRSSQIEQEARRRQKHQEDMQKMMKNKGVKNLLLRLRENVESSPTKAPEIIQSSKLISCGPSKSLSKELQYSSNKNSSKVLINPVPVDVVRKSQVIKKEKLQNLNISPIKQNPNKDVSSPMKSILKQTSNILTKSMSGNG